MALTLSRRSLLAAPLLQAISGKRPNILFCLADDWGPNHAGILGDPFIKTPTFDRIARQGVLFANTFVAAPTCTASRAAILTGQMPHRLGQAINLSCEWRNIPPLFTDLLRNAGYQVGYTRKGWGPGAHPGREMNPAGTKYEDFEAFLAQRPAAAPFFFWFGSHDPHRGYNRAFTQASGIDPAKVAVPPYLPDVLEVRQDLADYYAEVQRFDTEVGELLKHLAALGELENTIVVMTGDYGLPFPRAKGHHYDSGVLVPLAIRWGRHLTPDRRVTDFIGFTDFAPTFLELAGLPVPPEMTGRSFVNTLGAARGGLVDPERTRVFTERERHTWCHPDGKSFPVRAMRSDDHLFIWNLRPYLCPGGHPCLRRPHSTPKGHVDCDEGPSKYFLIDHRDDPRFAGFYQRSFGLRSEEELYDVKADLNQMRNLAQDAKYRPVLDRMRKQLRAWMKQTKDPRADGETSMWDASSVHLQPHADEKMPCYLRAQHISDEVRAQWRQ